MSKTCAIGCSPLQITNDIDAITKMMEPQTCVIADGHHRYETALNYYKETGEPSAQYVLTAFVNTRQKGLLILATHRLIQNVKNFNSKKFLADLKKDFDLTAFAFDDEKTKQQARQKMSDKMKADFDADKNAFGIYTADGAFYVAVLKDKTSYGCGRPGQKRTLEILRRGHPA